MRLGKRVTEVNKTLKERQACWQVLCTNNGQQQSLNYRSTVEGECRTDDGGVRRRKRESEGEWRAALGAANQWWVPGLRSGRRCCPQ